MDKRCICRKEFFAITLILLLLHAIFALRKIVPPKRLNIIRMEQKEKDRKTEIQIFEIHFKNNRDEFCFCCRVMFLHQTRISVLFIFYLNYVLV